MKYLINILLFFFIVAIINGYFCKKKYNVLFSLLILLSILNIFVYYNYENHLLLISVGLSLIYISCIPAIIEKSPTLEIINIIINEKSNFEDKLNILNKLNIINKFSNNLIKNKFIKLTSSNQFKLTLIAEIFIFPFLFFQRIANIKNIN